MFHSFEFLAHKCIGFVQTDKIACTLSTAANKLANEAVKHQLKKTTEAAEAAQETERKEANAQVNFKEVAVEADEQRDLEFRKAKDDSDVNKQIDSSEVVLNREEGCCDGGCVIA